MGKGQLRTATIYGAPDHEKSQASHMISIWDSGIEYAENNFGPSVYNTWQQDETLPSSTHDQQNRTNEGKSLLGRINLPIGIIKFEKNSPPQWSEFTRSTTFHGVRYLFDNGQSFAIRRILWFLCVTSAIFLFSYQVIDRARVYFQYDTNTNVEVVYVDKVEFPSITICNQNNYRITEVEDQGLYCYIDNIFSSDTAPLSVEVQRNNNNTSCDNTNTSNLNLTAFVLRVAHQKEDFIDSCKWKGDTCNISADFHTTMTDFGVCYTFNAHENLTLSHTGSGFALSLVLNIEQYQYMKGPQDEAGIKVLLHDYSEVPLVKDLGFAIAPGTHTLVAVQKQVVQALERPYGECVRDSLTRSECLSKCRTRFVLSRCHCRDVGMPAIQNSTVCSMDKAFTCVRNTMDSFTKEDQVCSCDIPCDRTTFQPELSYAHLSKLNINKISLNDVDKRERVQETFQYAREVGQRVNADIASKDNSLVTAVLEASNAYQEGLEHSLSVLDDPDYVNSQLGVVNVVSEDYPIFLEDFVLLDEIYSTKAKIMSDAFPKYKFYDDIASELSRVVELRNGYSTFKVKVSECASWERNGDNIKPPGVDSHYDCEDVNQYTYLHYKRNRIENIIRFINSATPSIENVKEDYKDLMRYIYGDSLINYRLVAQYHLCLDILHEVQIEWVPIMKEMVTTCEKYLNASSWAAKLSVIDSLIHYDNLTNSNSLSLTGRNYRTCNWYKIPAVTTLDDRNYDLFMAHSDSAKTSYYDARGIIQQLINQAVKMTEDFHQKQLSLLSPFRKFGNASITKTKLYKHMASNEFEIGIEDLRLSNERYLTDYRQFLSKVSDIENNLLLSYKYSFSFKIPVLNDSVISNLRFIKFVRDHQHLNEDIQKYLNSVKKTKESSLQGLVNEIYGAYRRMIQDVHSKILQSFQELTVSINLLQADLQTFVQGNEIGEGFFMDNFIKIDVFYKELSYEKIKQQVAFELLSLVSEIGGFLGLLLGASVLTVCELIDFLVLAGIYRCRSKNFFRRKDKDLNKNFRI